MDFTFNYSGWVVLVKETMVVCRTDADGISGMAVFPTRDSAVKWLERDFFGEKLGNCIIQEKVLKRRMREHKAKYLVCRINLTPKE